jgi:hypothetical protein
MSYSSEYFAYARAPEAVRVKLTLVPALGTPSFVSRILGSTKLMITVDPMESGASLIGKVSEMCKGRAVSQIYDALEDEPDLKLIVESFRSIEPKAYFTPDGFHINDTDRIADLFLAEINSPAGIHVKVEVKADIVLKDYSREGTLRKNGHGFGGELWAVRTFNFRGVLFPSGADRSLQGKLSWNSELRNGEKCYTVSAVSTDQSWIRVGFCDRGENQRKAVVLGGDDCEGWGDAMRGYMAAAKYVADLNKPQQ